MKIGDDQVRFDRGKGRLKVAEFSYTPEGGDEKTYVAVRLPKVSAVLPYHADGTITLIEQPRPVVRESVFEIPAGLIDPGESAEKAARRELQEETGLREADLRPLGTIWTSPGVMDEEIFLYLATGCVPGERTGGDADERIIVHRVDLDEVRRLLRAGKIRDSKTLAALALAGVPLA